MTEDSISIEDLTGHVGITSKDLDQQFSETHLTIFAKKIPNWEQYAKSLGLSEQHIMAIKTDLNLDQGMKTLRMLEKWKKRLSFKATYKRMVTICLEQEDADLAVEVCKLLKDEELEAANTSSVPSGTLGVLVSRVRDVLTTMRSVRDTSEKSSIVKQVVLDFVTNSIQSNISVDDIEETLHSLHKRELLFPEDALKEALTLAQKENFKRTQSAATKPSQASKAAPKEPLFSKDTVYHADICCRVLAEGDSGNYQSLFKKLPNGQGHSFKAVSMSRSKTECLLVAEQGESLIYFAFESRPQLSDWRDYKSFDEGVTLQSQQFPVRYIVELLNKQRSIVLTGFSFGGLLASTVTAMVWNLPYISSDLLKDNLTCITFGKPLVSVRIVQTVAQRRPDILSTIHSIQMESDIVPSLMSFLDVSWSAKDLSESDSGRAGNQVAMALSMDAPFQDPVTLSLVDNLQKIQLSSTESKEIVPKLRSKVEELKPKLPQMPDLPESVYNMLCDPDVGMVFKYLTNEEAREHFANSPHKFDEGIFKVHTATVYSRTVFLSHMDQEPKYPIPPAPKHAPQELQNLLPSLKEVHMHHFGGQAAIVIEGANLWFCREVSLLGYKQKVPASDVTGSSAQFNVESKEVEKHTGGQHQQTIPVMVYSSFSSKATKQSVPYYVKGYAVTTRQEQLAKLSPSQVIELAYLSALLERDLSDACAGNSCKLKVITAFLRDVVQVVPFESIGYAIAYSSYKTAVACYEALVNSGIEPPLTSLMVYGMQIAWQRMGYGIPPQVAIHQKLECLSTIVNVDPRLTNFSIGVSRDPKTSEITLQAFPRFGQYTLLGPFHETTISSDQVHSEYNPDIGKNLEEMSTRIVRIFETKNENNVVTELNIDLIYPVSKPKSEPKATLKSPIDILVEGREELSRLAGTALSQIPDSQLQQTKDCNQRMLDTLNNIRQTDLEICTSLLGGFMEQQDVDICLVKSHKDSSFAIALTAAASVGVWALFSLDYVHIQPILAQCDGEKLLVKILDYVKGISGISSDSEGSSSASYAAKLQFMTTGMAKTVTCNTQYVSYSLERQLVELCKSREIDASVNLSDLQNKWGKLFKENTLSLVHRAYRPLVGRWLKWALMIHNLREELASYTAVGVTGLVNSGKSKLINTLFGIKIPIGTTEENRTTVPFLYNLDESVEGLNVVDFPGVDDEDDTIGDLADLLITVAQIILFVVDYRKAHTQSAKKWLERLHKEKVPVLVCLTFGDKLYAEHINEKGVHLPMDAMSAVIKQQLAATEAKLQPTGSHKVSFFSFAQDNDSVLNSDEGREKLRDVGIGSPLQVGEWLVEVFKRDFDNEKLADQLEPFMHTNASQ